jgi:hypothetical protein
MSKIAFSLLLAGVLLAGQGRAQSRVRQRVTVVDTLFVYDTIFVTDTIRVRKPAKKMARVEPLPARTEPTFWVISSTPGATLLTRSIMGADTVFQFKQSATMKKVSFLGVVLFAFQHLVLAQNNLSLNVGTGGYNLRSTTGLTSKTAAQLWVGGSYARDFVGGKIGLVADLNYHYLWSAEFEPQPGAVVPIYDESFKQNYHLFNVPVAVQWNTRWLSPGFGAEWYYKLSPRIAQVLTDANGVPRNTSYRVPYHGGSWFAGVEVPCSSRAKARLRYYQGFTTEYKASFGSTSFWTKMRRLEVNLSYRLR